jgi:hypothetical protein
MLPPNLACCLVVSRCYFCDKKTSHDLLIYHTSPEVLLNIRLTVSNYTPPIKHLQGVFERLFTGFSLEFDKFCIWQLDYLAKGLAREFCHHSLSYSIMQHYQNRSTRSYLIYKSEGILHSFNNHIFRLYTYRLTLTKNPVSSFVNDRPPLQITKIPLNQQVTDHYIFYRITYLFSNNDRRIICSLKR